MNHLLIYADRTSNRLTYIFDFILGELLGLTYELTNSRDKFLQYEGAKFSYASQPAGDELFFETSQLLFETNIVRLLGLFAHGIKYASIRPVLSIGCRFNMEAC